MNGISLLRVTDPRSVRLFLHQHEQVLALDGVADLAR